MSKLTRRAIRKRIMEQLHVPVQSHVDGTLSVAGTTPEALTATLNEWGYAARVLPSKLPDTVCVAVEETVNEGRRGQHHYRGPGEFALTGERAEVWAAGGLALQAQEQVAEEQEETPAPRRRNRRRAQS